jgi:hypothetical protein
VAPTLKEVSDWILLEKKKGARWATATDHHEALPIACAAMHHALARWGTPAIQSVPVSERPWEREGWCDAEGRCYGWDGDYWWMVGNPGWANETITHWLPHWALRMPTPANNTREENLND